MVHLYLECCAWFQSPPHKNNEVNLNNNREGWQGALEVKEQLLQCTLPKTQGMPQPGKAVSYGMCGRDLHNYE